MTGGRPRQDRATVYLLDQAIPGEYLEIPADGHIRDAEPLGEVADTCAAIAPDGLQDERLAVSGKHLRASPPSRRMASGAGGRLRVTSSVSSETFANRVRFRVRVSETDVISLTSSP